MVALGGKRAEGPCYGVYALKGGTLMAMAQTKFYGNAPTEIVIVGGTGVYQGVTGSIHSVTENETTNADTVTLHLPDMRSRTGKRGAHSEDAGGVRPCARAPDALSAARGKLSASCT